jgi:hypothetical protein
MAEATDLPPGAAEPAKGGGVPGPDWPAEGVTLSPAPAPPPAETTYRPLSGLALAAFLLAALYALAVTLGGVVAFGVQHYWWLLILTVLAPPVGLVVASAAGVRGAAGLLRWAGLSLLGLYALLGVFGLVAYSNTSPWMLPGWAVLVPLTAAVLAWLARGRIRDSEGTLGGGALASWGLGLSLFFGLTYVAYYAGAYVAVRQQAESFSREWIELLAQDRLPEAFARTMPARDRPTKPTRAEMEMRAMGGAAGPGAVQLGPSGYGQFCQIDFVRALRLGGPSVQIRPLGIAEWTYKSGTPEVKARYRIDTDVASFELLVTSLGSEAKAGEGGGRQWQIVVGSTGRPSNTDLTMTPKGQAMMQAFNNAGLLAQSWVSRVSRHDWDQAYLDTLPPKERDEAHRLREKWCDPAVGAAGGLGALGGYPKARAYLAGRARLFDGEFVNADPSLFWGPTERVRKEVPPRVRQAFRPDATLPDHFEMVMTRLPQWERDGNVFRFLVDTQMSLASPNGDPIPTFLVETQVEVEGDAPPDGFPGPDSWRVRRLDLVRGRSGGRPLPGPRNMPGMPGSAGAPR